jgi:hypothetical protein
MAYNLTVEKIKQIDDNLIITGYLNEISYYLRELKKDKNTEDEEKQLKKTRVALYSYRKKNASKLKTSDRRHQIDDCGERINEDYYQFRVTGRSGRCGGQGLGKNADQRALKNRHLYKIRGNIFIEYV